MTNPITQTLTTGVIGLGAMGHQMARHMRTNGYAVTGYDISAEAAAKSAETGVTIVSNVAEVGRSSDVVFVIVQTDKQVEDVIYSGGLLDALKPGSVICIASSVDPGTCRSIAEEAAKKGVDVLDTPLILGQEAANNGTLTIFVGGDEAVVGKVRPVLQTFGEHITRIGTIGHGQVAKTANNMLLWACICANFEALSLAKELGVDVPTLIKALEHSSGANNSLSRWGQSTGKWAEKDMDVALDLAQGAKVPMPLNGLVDQLMKTMNRDRMRSLLA
jgi:3-hydroxyisobutyrate dehydrogenase-like beta-hydroxyacid dehydrogenase